MPYFRGDMLLRGDPGFFGFLGKAVKSIAGAGLGFLTGGPLGAIRGAVSAASSMSESEIAAVGPRGLTPTELHALHTRDTRLAATRGIGSSTAGTPHGKMLAPARGSAAGGARRGKRMRVTNPKALRRAIRRTRGFAKLAMKVIHLVHPRKRARFGGFKHKKRAA